MTGKTMESIDQTHGFPKEKQSRASRIFKLTFIFRRHKGGDLRSITRHKNFLKEFNDILVIVRNCCI